MWRLLHNNNHSLIRLPEWLEQEEFQTWPKWWITRWFNKCLTTQISWNKLLPWWEEAGLGSTLQACSPWCKIPLWKGCFKIQNFYRTQWRCLKAIKRCLIWCSNRTQEWMLTFSLKLWKELAWWQEPTKQCAQHGLMSLWDLPSLD